MHSQLLEAALHEGTRVLTPEMIDQLRKDFLTLTGNLKRIKTSKDALKVLMGMRAWAQYLQDNIIQPLKAAEAPRNVLSAVWSLYITVRDFPFLLSEFEKRGEAHFESAMREMKAWDAKVKRYAREAWKQLDYYQSYVPDSRKTLRTPDEERMTIEGFAVIVRTITGNEMSNYVGRAVGRLGAALKVFKQRASRVFPWMVKNCPTIYADLSAEAMCGPAATYDGGTRMITVATATLTSNESPERMAYILAHEVGHHAFKTLLSPAARQGWHDLVVGSTVDLDLRDVIKRWRDGESYFAFHDRLEKEDPILALQLATLDWDDSQKMRFKDKADMAQEIADGNAILRVTSSPISGYAGKNTEESFCEALGLLVGYGPQAVLPQVRSWLRSVLPGLRVESEELDWEAPLVD